MKIFTETTKWRDPWFHGLSPSAKLFWIWLLDHCDKAGVVDASTALASFDLGCEVKEQHLAELMSRLHQLKPGRFLIPKFVLFQYGTLSDECRAHGPVFDALAKHGLTYSLLVGYAMGMDTPKYKREYKRKDSSSKEGGTEEENLQTALDISTLANVTGDMAMGRKKFSKPTVEMIRLHFAKIGLPEDEAENFWHYHESRGWVVGRAPMKSWQSACTTWKKNHEKFGNPNKHGPKANHNAGF